MNIESDDDDELADVPESSETEAVEVCLRCRCYSGNCSCVSDELFVTLYAVMVQQMETQGKGLLLVRDAPEPNKMKLSRL